MLEITSSMRTRNASLMRSPLSARMAANARFRRALEGVRTGRQQPPDHLILWDTRQSLRPPHAHAAHGVRGEETRLHAPSKERPQLAEVQVRRRRIHACAEVREILLDREQCARAELRAEAEANGVRTSR